MSMTATIPFTALSLDAMPAMPRGASFTLESPSSISLDNASKVKAAQIRAPFETFAPALSPPQSRSSATPPGSPDRPTSPLSSASLLPLVKDVSVAPRWWVRKQRKKNSRVRREIETNRAMEALMGKIGSQGIRAEVLLSLPKDTISRLARHKATSVTVRAEENRVLRMQIQERREQIEIMESLLEANERAAEASQNELAEVLVFARTMGVTENGPGDMGDNNDVIDDDVEGSSASAASSSNGGEDEEDEEGEGLY